MEYRKVLICLDSSIGDESSIIHFLKYSDGHEVLDMETDDSYADMDAITN